MIRLREKGIIQHCGTYGKHLPWCVANVEQMAIGARALEAI
jgi:hypothetical protein